MNIETITKLLECDRVYPYQIDEDAYHDYAKALEVLSKTKLRYTADDPDQNFVLHCVEIEWRASITQISCKLLTRIFQYFDELVFDQYENSWMLSKVIYKEVSN